MSFESKALLLKSLEKELSTKLTAANMAIVLSSLSDQLEDFKVIQSVSDKADDSDLLQSYFSAMKIEGRSEKTIARYKYILKKMMDFSHVSTRNITVYHLREYLANEKSRGISDRTLEGTRQVFSAFFNWLQRERLIEYNPCANLGAIKYQKKIKHTYNEIDIEKMKFACKTLRDRAITAFMMSTGCRVSEITQLNRADVDLINLECKVLGKGNKERTVFIDQVTAMLLKEYFAQRTDDLPALFIGIGKRSERITPAGIRKMLRGLQQSAGVSHVHPHKFRRTLATNLIRHGMPIQEVAAILGHEKLDTTMQYVVLDKTDVKNSYRKYA